MKIASKALVLRVEKILPEIIQVDQYAYIKGRTIFDAIRTIDDIVEYTKIQQLSGLMVAFDFEKAFDSLSWSFLFRQVKQDENCVAQSLLDKETSKYTFFARKIRKNTIRFEATASSSVVKGNCKLWRTIYSCLLPLMKRQ